MPQRAWILVAVVVTVGGIMSAFIVASSVAHNDAAKSQQEFKRSSGEVASTLQLAIQHETDLVVSAGAFRVQNPNATVSEFDAWLHSMHAFQRYPELEAIGSAVLVRDKDLSAFSAEALSDPPGTLSADGSFDVTPSGQRPFYCLSVVGATRPGSPDLPAGQDFCGYNQGPLMLRARDSGMARYNPLPNSAGQSVLGTNTPIYRRGITPSTVEARRRAFLGWVGSMIDPAVVLNRALKQHPHTKVAFRYRDANSDVVFRSGSSPATSQTSTVSLHNGWTVKISGPAAAAGILANRDALVLLIAGIVLSLLLGTLVLVLATGRSRARRLVVQKTRELNHLATHDALTGLPNRALVMDRTEQMLARAERRSVAVAALFIDVDGFKQVNDKLGHAAGDRVLQTIADRLTYVVRGEDTVGRLGGDEFVVLLESTTIGESPEMVAERIVSSLHEPIELDDGRTATVSASIGIALSRDHDADELLSDADLALYVAKDGGRDRYVTFTPKLRRTAAASPAH